MYEIHDYHFNPEKFEEYKAWVIEEVVPYLRANMDLVSFWVGEVAPSKVGGTSPMSMNLGTPNATWIARWDSMEDCIKSRETVLATEEWKKIWANHPDEDGYLQYQSRYMEGY